MSIPAMSSSGTINKTKSEVKIMKNKILQIQSSDSSNLNEKYYKHRLAYTQAALLKKDITLYILSIYKSYGMSRNFNDIYDAVDVSFESAFIFPELGSTHTERFVRIVSWAKAETNFSKNEVSYWKKGQYIRSLDTTIKQDTADYGMWQINRDNLKYAKKVNYLYSSGTITYKVRKIRTLNDLFDIRTNCAARCVIETDRKNMGMSWKHDRERVFIQRLANHIKNLEKEGVYNSQLIQRYYHLVEIKTYN
jgi:hypothetical protein